MDTIIPYDPNLVLGMIVRKEKIENLKNISILQIPINNAKAELNSKISHSNLIASEELGI